VPDTPGDDVLDDEVVPPRRRRRLSPLTAALVLVLVAACGVYAGVRLQKDRGGSSSSSTLSALASRFAAGGTGSRTGRTGFAGTFGGTGTGGTGGAGASGGAGGATFGTVKLVDGDNIYVTTSDGSIVKVKTSGTTTITKTAPAKVSQIEPGETVVVRGSAGTDGTVAASSVTDAGGTSTTG
jgi:hypothetical protein